MKVRLLDKYNSMRLSSSGTAKTEREVVGEVQAQLREIYRSGGNTAEIGSVLTAVVLAA